jgi:hypothetical protein
MFSKARQLRDAAVKPGGGWVSKNAPPKNGQAAWRADTLEGLEKGSRVWHKAGPHSWVLGTLLAPAGGGAWSVALDCEAGEGMGPVRSLCPTTSAPGVLYMHACMRLLCFLWRESTPAHFVCRW